MTRRSAKAERAAGRGARAGGLPAQAGGVSGRVRVGLMLLAVAAAVSMVHAPVLSTTARFVDDDVYVFENPLVLRPGWESARRLVTEVWNPSTVRGYYQPLAMLSLMADVAMGGGTGNLAPFHRTSLLLHAANAALLAWIIWRLFGSLAAAGAIGLVFGLHPLTVEPVAWIADRKTLVAAFFALAAVGMYLRFVRTRGVGVYAMMAAAYVLSMVAKPTGVLLPMALVLMDVWPLGRWTRGADGRSVRGLLLEKLPLVALMAAFAFIARASTITALDEAPVEEANLLTLALIAASNVVFYLGRIAWPAGLSPHYPFPPTITAGDPAFWGPALAVVMIFAGLVAGGRRTRPLLAGFLMFGVLLAPTFAIVRATIAIAADKYVYLPLVGLALPAGALLAAVFAGRARPGACARAAADSSRATDGVPHAGAAVALFDRRPGLRAIVALGLVTLCVAEAWATRRQVGHWRDTESIHARAIEIAPTSAFPRFGLAHHFQQAGDTVRAERLLREAIALRPAYGAAHANLGLILAERGAFEEALTHYDAALTASNGRDADVLNNRGLLLNRLGRVAEAEADLRRATALAPRGPAPVNLAGLLASAGRTDEALTLYKALTAQTPARVDALNNYAHLLLVLDRPGPAREALHKALAADPDSAPVHYHLGWSLLVLGDSAGAIRHLQAALRAVPGNVDARLKLARAFAAAGDTAAAVAEVRTVLEAAPGHAEAAALLDSLTAGASIGAGGTP